MVLVLLLLQAGPLFSQMDAPQEVAQEYVPPEQLVSLNSGLDITIALDMLSEYAIRFAGKPIHDPTKQNGSINIEISSMAWEKALKTILARRGLWYENRDHFFEVVLPSSSESIEEEKNPYGEEIRYKLGSREVKIETIFFEGDRRALSEIGIDWSTFYRGKVDIATSQLGSSFLENKLFSFNLSIPKKLAKVDIRALFQLFDSRNIGRVLAQPQVVVTEGNEGKIQVGQDFSIKTRDFAGNLMDRFISTGTILQVTPHIVKTRDKGAIILLKAHVERSQAFPDVVSTIIKKSEANSLVQLYDGEETLIAGLYTNEKTTMRKGLPLVKDLPWYVFGLRYIFGYNRYEDVQKELIIILKATLLPDVYARQTKESGVSKARSTLEERLRLYRFDESTSNLSDIEANTPARPEEQKPSSPSLEKPEAERQSSSSKNDATGLEKPAMDIRNGTVQNVNNDLLLINWETGFNAAVLVNQTVTIVRRNGKGFEPIAKAEVLQAKYRQTVARRVDVQGMANSPLRAGDRAVVRYADHTGQGESR